MPTADKLNSLQKEVTELKTVQNKKCEEAFKEGVKSAETNLIPQLTKLQQEKTALDKEKAVLLQRITLLEKNCSDLQKNVTNLSNNPQITQLTKERDEARRQLGHFKEKLKSDINAAVKNNKQQLDDLSARMGRRLDAVESMIRDVNTRGGRSSLSFQEVRDIEIEIKNELKATQESNKRLIDKLSSI